MRLAFVMAPPGARLPGATPTGTMPTPEPCRRICSDRPLGVARRSSRVRPSYRLGVARARPVNGLAVRGCNGQGRNGRGLQGVAAGRLPRATGGSGLIDCVYDIHNPLSWELASG